MTLAKSAHFPRRRLGLMFNVASGHTCARPFAGAAKTERYWPASLTTLFVLLFLPAGVFAEGPVGKLIYGRGQAQVVRNLKPQSLVPGAPIESNDTMRVQIGGRIKSILDDDSIVMIWEDTEIRLENIDIDLIQGKRIIEIEQINGNLRLIAADFLGDNSQIRIRTPNAKIELQAGADAIVRQGVQGDNTEIIVIAGGAKVEHVFSEFEGAVQLEPQQTSIVGVERAPSQPVFMERNAFDKFVQENLWTLPQPVPDWNAFLEQRLEDYGVRAFGRVRRLAAKPTTPIHVFFEGLTEQQIPDRSADMRPEPLANINVTVECASCAQD